MITEYRITSTPAERAMEMLGDYLFELETGYRRRSKKAGRGERTIRGRAIPAAAAPASGFDKAQEAALKFWLDSKTLAWGKAGRLTADGTLRLTVIQAAPYTLEAVAGMFPSLRLFDRLAVLIDLDGVVQEGFMASGAHENIKAVMEKIAGDVMERKLQDPAQAQTLRNIVRAEVSSLFEELHARLNSGRTIGVGGGKKNKCSKCSVPGHTSRTCKASVLEIERAAQKKEDAERDT